MYQLSYVKHCQFIILTFIAGLLWVMRFVQSVSPKPEPGHRGKVPTLGGLDSEPDVEPAVHHLDDADNYLKICNFSNFKHCLTV
jgi:hypothetical protein